jgi:hypothetical protein
MKLKIVQDEVHHEYTLYISNEANEWKPYNTYSAGCVFVEDYDDYCDWSVDAEILKDIMELVNEGYTFAGTEHI